LVVLAGGGAVAWSAVGRSARAEVRTGGEMVHTVGRGPMQISLVENGTLVAKESRSVVYEGEHGGKIAFLIEEGKEVQTGDVLCKLETKEIEDQIQQTELSVVQAESDLKNAQTEQEIQRTDATGNLEKARLALEKARRELQRYQEGDAPQEERKLTIAIKDAETEFRRKRKVFEDSKTLVEQGYIKRTELENDEIAFEKAQVQLEGSKLDLRIFQEFVRPMTMAEKTNAVADADRELQATEKRNESQRLQKEVGVTRGQKQLTRHKQALEQNKKTLEKMVLRSPCSGIVLHGDPKQPWYSDNIKVGGQIWGSLTVCTIPDLSVMQVRLQIHEADINKIKTSLKATVTMDSYPGVVLQGEVTKIAAIANAGGMRHDAEVKKFDVEITLEQREGLKLRPGISAKAEVQIDRLEDVLSVPLHAVLLEGGTHACYVMDVEGKPVRREVKVGKSNDRAVEVTAGLAAGDRVLLYNPNLPTGGVAPGEDAAPSAAASERTAAAAAPATAGPSEH
jgi:RND family efflux transporter MFP subunit